MCTAPSPGSSLESPDDRRVRRAARCSATKVCQACVEAERLREKSARARALVVLAATLAAVNYEQRRQAGVGTVCAPSRAVQLCMSARCGPRILGSAASRKEPSLPTNELA